MLTAPSQIPQLFKTVNQELVANTPEQNAVGLYMRRALAAFAKNPTVGLQNFGWPKYHPLTNSLIRLGYKNRDGPNKAIGDLYDLSCLIL